MQPLRSTASTAASSLLRVAPSQCLASVLSYSRFQSFVFLPWHQGDWFPQCPIKACIRLTPLYAGHHLLSNRVASRLILKSANASSFDVFSRLMTLNHCGCVVSLEKTSKLEALALFRINLLATRLLSRWCPAYRWRESDAGFYRALREPVALMPREKHKRLKS